MTESIGNPGFLVEIGIMMFSTISYNYFCYANMNARKVQLFVEKVLATDSLISDHAVLHQMSEHLLEQL